LKSFPFVIGVALSIGQAAPALAQAGTPVLGKEERASLLAAHTALQARDYATAGTAIQTAKSVARSPETRYLAASLQLKLGIETSNSAAQAQGIEAMIDSGAAPATELEELYKNQGALGLSSGKWDKAEAAFTRWAEIAPNNPEALLTLAEVKDDRKKLPEAVALIDRAIELRRAAGQPVPESWYKRGLKHAFDAKMAPASLKFAQGLVSAYPSPKNWRDSMLVYRDIAQPDPATRIDALRLVRSAHALSGERDYMEAAEALAAGGTPAEAKAVLDEGVAAKMVDPAKPAFKDMIAANGKKATAEKAKLAGLRTKALAASTGELALAAGDAHYGAGDYAKAAELYRAAIQKGGTDADIANMHLGMALALGGQRAEAETALRAVAGQRAALASYWLVWLAQSGRPA
jgi:tetratricopeptide (TPR) repeat protein